MVDGDARDQAPRIAVLHRRRCLFEPLTAFGGEARGLGFGKDVAGRGNQLVLDVLAGQLLTPDRLGLLSREVQKHRRATASGNIQRRDVLRRQLKEAGNRLQNLYTALAEG